MKFKTLYGYEELPDTKQCSKCGEWKHFSAFGLRIGRLGSYSDTDPQNQGQRRNECDECKKRITKQIKEAKKMAPPMESDHVCPICKRNDEEIRGEGNLWKNKSVFVLDHDHDTGKFRGWPCQYCNILIGNANEDTRVLERAIDYLNNSKDL
tara:strand:- start:143 stop:598 length:456 start_codon:yes stop_codon:yes gene_type:complete